MPGPPKKPQELKELDGDIHKERWNRNAPKPEKGIPPCPAHLKGAAKTEWRRIVPELDKLGLLTQIDRAALAAYCEAYREWSEACKLMEGKSPIIRTEAGNIIQNPLVGIKHKAAEHMHKFLIEFGMTPASRTRISVTPKGKEIDPMEELFAECKAEQGGR